MTRTEKAINQHTQSFMGSLRLLEKQNDYLYRVELALLNDQVNRNNWRYENLESHRALFAGTPILCAFVGDRVGDGHNFEVRRDENGKEYASFLSPTAERIVGSLSDDPADIRLAVRNGHKWIIGTGSLWAWYAPELVAKIAQQGRGMAVSIETEILKQRMEGKTEVFEKYVVLGTTILGDGVMPAVAGASIQELRGMESEITQLKIKAASYQPHTPPVRKKCEEKGVKQKEMKDRKQTALPKELEGYRILAKSEDGKHMCMLAKDGAVHGYYACAEDEKNGMQQIRVSAMTEFEDGETVAVDVEAALKTLSAEITELSGKLEEANRKMNAFHEAARESRMLALKNAMQEKLNEINEMRLKENKETLNEDVMTSALESIRDYDVCETEEEQQKQEKEAVNCLMAKCMQAIIDMDQALHTKQLYALTWGEAKTADKKTGIAGVLERIND